MTTSEGSDSLGQEDRVALSEAVQRFLPSYRLGWHANAEAMVWAVLDQPGAAARQPRFTICRLDRCLVMMIEAGTAARQFCRAETMAEAVVLACGIAREVMAPCSQPAASHGVSHGAPAALQ